MRTLFGTLILVACSILSVPSYAGALASTTTFSGSEETVFSVGLRLEFGDIVKPSVVVGVRRTETDTNNDVTGALAEIAIPVAPNSTFIPSFRVMGIFGDTNVQGLAGIGFDFDKNQFLVGLGAQGNFVDGGVNIKADGSISPYIGGSSYDGPSTRKETTIMTSTGG